MGMFVSVSIFINDYRLLNPYTLEIKVLTLIKSILKPVLM